MLVRIKIAISHFLRKRCRPEARLGGGDPMISTPLDGKYVESNFSGAGKGSADCKIVVNGNFSSVKFK
jgi:hypothetical protein